MIYLVLFERQRSRLAFHQRREKQNDNRFQHVDMRLVASKIDFQGLNVMN